MPVFIAGMYRDRGLAERVITALLDSGVARGMPGLRARVVRGPDLSGGGAGDRHGTAVASVLAASMPPFVPRHDMTVAFGARPPSRISSQPISERPCAVRNASICFVNQLCSSSSLCSPNAWIRDCASALVFHWVLIASSPPVWM